MTKKFGLMLNELLVDTFNSIKRIEENSLQARHDIKLTISEYHLIESVGRGYEHGRSISHIASDLGISNATVTIGVNKLIKKGLLEKYRSLHDGRVVFVKLTREGRRINAGHRLFHQHMISNLGKEFDDDELKLLMRCFEKMNGYFKRYNRVVQKHD